MTDCSSQAPACTCSAGALHITCNFAGHNCFTNHADTAELLWLMLHSSPPENSTAILPQAHSCQRVCTSVCMLPHIPLYVWLEPTVLACRNACLVMSDRMQATFLLPDIVFPIVWSSLYVLLAPVYVGLGGDRNIPANLPRPH